MLLVCSARRRPVPLLFGPTLQRLRARPPLLTRETPAQFYAGENARAPPALRKRKAQAAPSALPQDAEGANQHGRAQPLSATVPAGAAHALPGLRGGRPAGGATEAATGGAGRSYERRDAVYGYPADWTWAVSPLLHPALLIPFLLRPPYRTKAAPRAQGRAGDEDELVSLATTMAQVVGGSRARALGSGQVPGEVDAGENQNASALAGHARALHAQGHLAPAELLYRRALLIAPGSPDTLVRFGDCIQDSPRPPPPAPRPLSGSCACGAR